jgi:hypothetical protein
MESQSYPLEKLLRATEVAEILNISRAMTYRLIQIGNSKRIWKGGLATFKNRLNFIH